MSGGRVQAHEVDELAQYAADRGVTFTASSIRRHFQRRGRRGTQRYIDSLCAVMDAAAILRVDCTQSRAAWHLSRTREDARCVIFDFAARCRRRADRHRAACRVAVPPRTPGTRANTFAGCGCPRCRDRLVEHMRDDIDILIASPLCRDLDPGEARTEAYDELIDSIESWPGGNFTGWFVHRFKRRVKAVYRSRRAEQRRTVSLDSAAVLADAESGRLVSLAERLPDRTVDVAIIAIALVLRAEAALALRELYAQRCEQYEQAHPPGAPGTGPRAPGSSLDHAASLTCRVASARASSYTSRVASATEP